MKGAKNRTRDEYSVSEQITQLYNLINHRGSLFFFPLFSFHTYVVCMYISTRVWEHMHVDAGDILDSSCTLFFEARALN